MRSNPGPALSQTGRVQVIAWDLLATSVYCRTTTLCLTGTRVLQTLLGQRCCCEWSGSREGMRSQERCPQIHPLGHSQPHVLIHRQPRPSVQFRKHCAGRSTIRTLVLSAVSIHPSWFLCPGLYRSKSPFPISRLCKALMSFHPICETCLMNVGLSWCPCAPISSLGCCWSGQEGGSIRRAQVLPPPFGSWIHSAPSNHFFPPSTLRRLAAEGFQARVPVTGQFSTTKAVSLRNIELLER